MRRLTKRERVLLTVLAVLAVFFGYYRFFLQPMQEQTAADRESLALRQVQIDAQRLRQQQYEKMEAALEQLRDQVEPIPAYDNSDALMKQLHAVLAGSRDYSVDFSTPVSREGYLVLRTVAVSFRSDHYFEARQVINALDTLQAVNQITDLTFSQSDSGVRTSLKIIYFEIDL